MKYRFTPTKILFGFFMLLIGFKVSADDSERIKANEAIAIKSGAILCRYAIASTLHDPETAMVNEKYAFKKTKKGYHYQYQVRARNAFNAMRLGLFNCYTVLKSETEMKVIKVEQQQ